jgi:GTPase SAR1 family protein
MLTFKTRVQMSERRVLIVVGEAGVGKSSLVAALAGKSHVENRRPTIGADIEHMSDGTADVLVYDVSGNTMMQHIATTLARNATHAIVAYDAATPSTLKAATDIWLPLMRDTRPHMRLLLVALRVDLMRADTGDEARARIARTGVPFAEACATTGSVGAVRAWIYAEEPASASADDEAPLLAGGSAAGARRCCCCS